jgi:molybdopterin converting factor subunit 1
VSSIRILYFAAVRDLVGMAEETIELPGEARSVAELAAHLELLHPELAGRLGSVRLAVNEQFAGAADPVRPGDVVALIPPVAGG